MKARITANQLADLLAGEMDIDSALARNFIAALFAETAATLEAGKPATIKGFGEFLTDGTFIPDEALADEVNAPFSAFEPVELAEGVTDDMLAENSSEASPESKPEPKPIIAPEPKSEPQTLPPPPPPAMTMPPQPKPQPEPILEPEPEPVVEETPEVTPEAENTVIVDDGDYHYYDEPPQRRVPLWLIAAIFTIIGFAAGYIVSELVVNSSKKSVTEEAAVVESFEDAVEIPANSDTVFSAGQQPEVRQTVTDTVRAGYYFTTMARRHYGDKSFWVYIYEENAESRGFTHPERVAPGTVVTIPSREKYGIDPDNPESVKTAKNKAYEIYSRCQ